MKPSRAGDSKPVMVPDLLDATDEMQSLCVRIAGDLHEVERWIRAAR